MSDWLLGLGFGLLLFIAFTLGWFASSHYSAKTQVHPPFKVAARGFDNNGHNCRWELLWPEGPWIRIGCYVKDTTDSTIYRWVADPPPEVMGGKG